MSHDAPIAQQIDQRYEILDTVGAGGMGKVYRVNDRLTGEMIALKRVNIPGEKLTFTSLNDTSDFRVALAKEFQMLASLRHPNIIGVRDYGFDAQNQPYFTLDYLQNAQPITEAATSVSHDQKLIWFAQLLQALMYLHRRGVIHRDLKPDNVLVADNTVKVLDFGLAIAGKYVQDEDDGHVVGTIAYLAPEILKSQGIHTEASDLFATGLIAYELFAGRYPFETDNVSALIMDIVQNTPDVYQINIDEELQYIIGRLVQLDPADRFNSAEQVLDELNRYRDTGETTHTETIRESYLQAAQFVGRDEEMRQLLDRLDATIEGNGSALLIGGESGVGKSRLMDELRTRALIRGALVLRGQGVEGGGAPYQLWRPVVRRLAIQTPLSDDDAAILSRLVPDMASLLGRDIPDPPRDDDPQVIQNRLALVIETMLAAQSDPVVLLLEDLQWADESINLLRLVLSLTETLPVFICGNYRNDERPTLPDELPRAATMSLTRLDTDAIADLSASMIGNNGRKPEVVELLRQETEGNIFFIVEVMRALADELGDLHKIGTETLPPRVFAGGMQAIIQRRLNNIPADARPLLRSAAVAGRELDLDLLRHIAGSDSLDSWLMAVDSVLDVRDDTWRFAHDKLRESTLDELSPADKQHYHREVAQAIEAIYPDDPTYYAALARHWSAVGNRAKQWQYTRLAGQQAFENGAYDEAIRLLEQALSHQPDDAAPMVLAQIYRSLGEATIGIGKTMEGCRYLERASELYEYHLLVDVSQQRLIVDILWQLVVQGLIRAGVYRPRAPRGEKRERLQRALHLDEPLTRGYRVSNTDPLLLLDTNLRIANWAEPLGVSPQLAQATVLLGIIFSSTPLRSFSPRYIERAMAMLDDIEDEYAQMVVWRGRGFYYGGTGNWKGCIADSTHAQEMALDNQKWREAEELGLITAAAHLFGGEYAESNATLDDTQDIAERIGDESFLTYIKVGRVMNATWIAPADEYRDLIDDAYRYTLPDDFQSYPQLLMYDGIAHFKAGDLDSATDQLEAALDAFDELKSFLFMMNMSLIYMTRFAYQLRERRPGNRRVQQLTQRALAHMTNFANLYAVANAPARLYEGIEAHLNGDTSKAATKIQHSRELARDCEMPYNEACALLAQARYIVRDADQRTQLFDDADAIFEALGLQWERDAVARARQLASSTNHSPTTQETAP